MPPYIVNNPDSPAQRSRTAPSFPEGNPRVLRACEGESYMEPGRCILAWHAAQRVIKFSSESSPEWLRNCWMVETSLDDVSPCGALRS